MVYLSYNAWWNNVRFPNFIHILYSHSLCVSEGNTSNVSPVTPGNGGLGSSYVCQMTERLCRRTFSEAFGRLKSRANLPAGCKADLWKEKARRENLLHANCKGAGLRFAPLSLSDGVSPKADTERFSVLDLQRVLTRITGLSSRFKCLLKCNYDTCFNLFK